MTDDELDHARGYALLLDAAEGSGLTDSDLERAKRAESGDAWLFTPDHLCLDGWRQDPVLHVWIPPARDDLPVNPVRSMFRGREDRRAVPPASSPAAELVELTDSELEREIQAADVWKHWSSNPQQWRHRWDRRAVLLGRSARR